MSGENPFRVLGIAPQLAMSLSQEQLRAYVKDIYRSLQKIFHPDKGGDSNEARRINEAMAKLNDEALFMLSWQEFVGNPNPRMSALESDADRMRARVQKLEKREKEMEGDIERLGRTVANQGDQMAQMDKAIVALVNAALAETEGYRFHGLEVTFERAHRRRERPSTGTIHIEGKRAFMLNDNGTELNAGRVIGSIKTEHLALFPQLSSPNGYPFDAIKGSISRYLRLSLSRGVSILCLKEKSLVELGVITQIGPSGIVNLRRLSMPEELGRRYKMFVDREVTRRRGPLGMHYSYFPDRFTGYVTSQGEDGERVLAVRCGKVLRYQGSGRWKEASRLIGSVEAEHARILQEKLGGLDEKVYRKEFKRYLREGGFIPVIKDGLGVIALLEGYASRLVDIECIGSRCVPINENLLADGFFGALTLRGEEPGEILLVENGIVLRMGEEGEREEGRLIGSVSQDNKGGKPLMVPWVEVESDAVIMPKQGAERRLGICNEVDSFMVLSKEKTDNVKRRFQDQRGRKLRKAST